MSECNRHVPRLEFDVSIDDRTIDSAAIQSCSAAEFDWFVRSPVCDYVPPLRAFLYKKNNEFLFLRIENSIRWPDLPFEIAEELYGQYELIEYKRLTVACQLILHTILRFHVIVGFTELLGLYHSQ